ncbi:response regulator [Skermanella pratensis]|uniref:response regulator n=1 Tax=Skermanella pratensis TaxID=2233999 RepID=UPI0013013CFB|nr:response regulator [Skermanella pratensis]
MRVYARELNEHLPSLRRYARALTGSVERGDDLVTRCVEIAVMAPTRFGVPLAYAGGLYALLHALFDQDGEGRPDKSPHPIERALARRPEIERRLYLLVALEDLPVVEAAKLVDLTVAQATEKLTAVREFLRLAMTARVLVVEDNALAAVDLSEMISDMGHVVCGTAATEPEALALANAESPTLAVLDIRLARGGSGISVARMLRDRFAVPVIFVTAYAGDLRLLDEEGLGPVIRKPYTTTAVRDAISQAVFAPMPEMLLH